MVYQQPQNVIAARLGTAHVEVAFEFEPEEGDGWELPRYEATYEPIAVNVNGKWVDAELFAEEQLDAWRGEARRQRRAIQSGRV